MADQTKHNPSKRPSIWASWRRAVDRIRRRPKPALPVQDSVTRNFLVCLDTGTRHVALRRHIKETLKLTPEQYRRRWGLPDDYPMVASSYALRRSAQRCE